MIYETIITTCNADGSAHPAPLGIHWQADSLIIAPFRPCRTLENLERNAQAVINFCDDVRIFAGCLTGRREWSSYPAQSIQGHVLTAALSHAEVQVTVVEADAIRPRFHCKILHNATHAPFRGFNRAQSAVIEAAILISRLQFLPLATIQKELDHLQIAVEKTAGEREREAWQWLMDKYKAYQQEISK
ncbi:DUF447 domain-containing protein [Beggiatoa leptomitoformis]|uniref:DUF447 family protein n=1 Tax=Beggiatoa leptomitoformis TaxID=288004 RepID=A0A2N9YBQ4_9GAMM|nr:DUF447 domain-containing protein [Beggiatoa leptomitoformis]ALG66743.1 DUF447 family protein [Beggiatoa leptomitoformis]AUI67918.1 DUF447 family protein [Beggiatoa leptomitoformis]